MAQWEKCLLCKYENQIVSACDPSTKEEQEDPRDSLANESSRDVKLLVQGEKESRDSLTHTFTHILTLIHSYTHTHTLIYAYLYTHTHSFIYTHIY